MTTRILGPTESRRRRRFLLAPIFLVALVALFVTAGAQAVHDIGVFQLDKDATTLESPPALGEDWDLICKAHPTTCAFAPGYAVPAGTTTANPSSFVVDPSESAQDDILKGGTKDDNEISSWKWASAKPAPPKNDLTHGFAAEYAATDGDKILYFGADRFSRNGSANIAFWFFQDEITKASAEANGTCAAGAGCPFSGLHTEGSVPHDPDNPGDILIISAFGPKAAINVYEWVGIGNATDPPGPGGCFTANCSLEPLVVGGQACEDVTDDNACATVNDVVTPSPWTLNQKEGPANSFQPTNFFEGGLNLTALGIDACFSSFLINTRSSAAGDAELHDLILGQFARCVPGMTTQASTNGTVTPGTAVTDTATITVLGAGNPEDPTGTVTFFLCGPIATGDCGTSSGTNIGTGTLNGGTPDDGIATALSPTVNDSTQTGARGPLASGRYCFRATWPGDANYATPLNVTNDTTECFSVQDTSSITTAQSWLPQDSATVTLGSGGTPSGAVVFSLYENGTCSGTAAATFTDSSAPFETDNTTYRTSSTIISWSATFTSSDSNVQGSTTTRCERSDLTINNSASDFPPPTP